MATADEESAKASAIGRAIDRQGHLRNKLVQVVQGHPDENVRQQARGELQRLLSSGDIRRSNPGQSSGLRSNDQSDPDPIEMQQPSLGERFGASVGSFAIDKARRRQALSVVDDVAAFGLGKKVANAFGTTDFSPEQRRKDAQESPLSDRERAGIALTSLLTPAGGLTRAAGATAERALMNVPGMVKAAQAAPKLVGAGVGAASALGGDAITQGATSAIAGEGMGTALTKAKEAGTNPWTAAAGGALGSLFGAGAAARARNQNVRTIEEAGGQVTMTSPGKGAPFKDPLVAQGIDDVTGRVTEFGRGKVARAAARGTDEALAGRAQGINQQMQAAKKAAVESGRAAEDADITDLVKAAHEMANDPRLPRSVRNTVKTEVIEDMIDQFGAPTEAGFAMPAIEANALRKKIFDLADMVNPKATDPDLKRLGGAAKGAVDDTVYGDINAPYAAEASKLKEARRALEFPKADDVNRRLLAPDEELKVANVLSRTGQDTARAGMQDTPEMAKAVGNYPELGRFTKAVPLLDARSALEFKGLNDMPTGGLYVKELAKLLGQNLDAAKTRIAAPVATGVGKQAPIAGSILEILQQGAVERRRRNQR